MKNKLFQFLLIICTIGLLTSASQKQKITSLQLENLKGKVKLIVITFNTEERQFTDSSFYSSTGMAERNVTLMKSKYLDLHMETFFEYDDEGYLKKEYGNNLKSRTKSIIEYTKTRKGNTTILSFESNDKSFKYEGQKFIVNGRIEKETTETSNETTISKRQYDKNNIHISTIRTIIPVKKKKPTTTDTTFFNFKEFDKEGNWLTSEASEIDGKPHISNRIIYYY